MTQNRTAWVVLAAVLMLAGCRQQNTDGPQKICFHGRCVGIETVRTSEERSKGLQNREFMSRDHGMLFVFPASKPYAFWMKDTLIPLDMIWIDENKKAVTVLSNVLPCKTEKCPVYRPKGAALYVLEVNAGVAVELDIQEGDLATF